MSERGSKLKTLIEIIARSTDEHQVPQDAEREREVDLVHRIYHKLVLILLLLGLACNSVTIIVLSHGFTGRCVPLLERPVVQSDSKAAAPIGMSLFSSVKDTSLDPSPVSVPGLKKCAVAPRGAGACWELADPAMTAIPNGFLQGNTNFTGTLRVGPAVQSIGARALFGTKLTGLDLSERCHLAR